MQTSLRTDADSHSYLLSLTFLDDGADSLNAWTGIAA